MKRFWKTCASAAVLAAVGLASGGIAAGGAGQAAAQSPAQGAAARARADAIVARMTLDEKIALLHGLFPPMANCESRRALTRRMVILPDTGAAYPRS